MKYKIKETEIHSMTNSMQENKKYEKIILLNFDYIIQHVLE